MAQQFLNGSQITPSRQKMRGKGMAHGVRCGRGGQAQLRAGAFHHFLDQPRIQRPAARANKQRAVGGLRIRAHRDIGGHGHARGGDHRHHTHLAALAGDAQAFRQGGVGKGQRQRLGYPQATAVKQGHNRGVACVDPGRGMLDIDGVDQIARRLFGHRPWQAGAEFGGADRQHGGGFKPVIKAKPAVKAFDRRQAARQRTRGHTAPAFMGHKRAHICQADLAQMFGPGGLAQMVRQKMHKPAKVAPIGCNRFVGGVFKRGFAVKPCAQKRRAAIGQQGHVSQRRNTRSVAPAKKPKRSVP